MASMENYMEIFGQILNILRAGTESLWLVERLHNISNTTEEELENMDKVCYNFPVVSHKPVTLKSKSHISTMISVTMITMMLIIILIFSGSITHIYLLGKIIDSLVAMLSEPDRSSNRRSPKCEPDRNRQKTR